MFSWPAQGPYVRQHALGCLLARCCKMQLTPRHNHLHNHGNHTGNLLGHTCLYVQQNSLDLCAPQLLNLAALVALRQSSPAYTT